MSLRSSLCVVLGLTGTSGLALSVVRPHAVSAKAGRARAGTVVNQAGPDASTSSKWGLKDISPDGKFAQRVEGQTRKTWQFNDINQNRVQVAVTSEGRPMKADIQLWIGPDWTPFTLKAYSENGKTRPIQTIIGTRNKAAMVEVRNVGEYEFPFNAAANFAKGEMALLPTNLPETVPGERIQGKALRSFPLDPASEQLECVLKTSGKQLNARIELLNAPNNPKQTFEVFTNNGELNSLVVCFNVDSDPGNTVRIVNLAPVEFPLECYIKEKIGTQPPSDAPYVTLGPS